jgi:hypothetical protein
MKSSFTEKFKTKSTSELLEIVNSSGYQESARNAATNLLVERGEQQHLKTSTRDFSKLELNELLKNLSNYEYDFELTSSSLKIYRDQRTGFTGTVLFFVGLAFTLFVLFNWWTGNTSWTLRYSITFGLLAMVLGWSRLRTSNYSYLSLNKNGISLKKSNDETKSEILISNSDFNNFSTRKYSRSVSIFLNCRTAKSISVVNLKLKTFESTPEFANELAERLNAYVKDAR